MPTTATQELTVDASLSDFLIRNDAEREFRKVCELVRASFPELIGLDVMLQEEFVADFQIVLASLPSLQIVDGARNHLQLIGRVGRQP